MAAVRHRTVVAGWGGWGQRVVPPPCHRIARGKDNPGPKSRYSVGAASRRRCAGRRRACPPRIPKPGGCGGEILCDRWGFPRPGRHLRCHAARGAACNGRPYQRNRPQATRACRQNRAMSAHMFTSRHLHQHHQLEYSWNNGDNGLAPAQINVATRKNRCVAVGVVVHPEESKGAGAPPLGHGNLVNIACHTGAPNTRRTPE